MPWLSAQKGGGQVRNYGAKKQMPWRPYLQNPTTTTTTTGTAAVAAASVALAAAAVALAAAALAVSAAAIAIAAERVSDAQPYQLRPKRSGRYVLFQ